MKRRLIFVTATVLPLLLAFAACTQTDVPLQASSEATVQTEDKQTPVPVVLELTEAEQAPLPDNTLAPAPQDVQAAEGGTEILMINVGKGDAILIKTAGKAYLIDGGKAINAGTVLSALREEGITRLDAVFLTHTDDDHTGVLPVLGSAGIAVGTWYASRYYASPKKQDKHPAVRAAALAGQSVTWLSEGDIAEGVFTVLAPVKAMEDEDDNSLVMMLSTEYGKVLLTGDMELSGEELLLSRTEELACDVVKIPNHADDDAASEEFLKRTGAKIALISTSPEEKPGTPSYHIESCLRAMGTEIYSTEGSQKGIRVAMDAEGVRAGYCVWEESAGDLSGVTITDADASNDTVTVANGGIAAADLSGCTLVSDRGEDLFLFPQGTVLPAGSTLTVGSRSANGAYDLLWDAKNVLHNKKEDTVTLRDAHGTVVTSFTTNP